MTNADFKTFQRFDYLGLAFELAKARENKARSESTRLGRITALLLSLLNAESRRIDRFIERVDMPDPLAEKLYALQDKGTSYGRRREDNQA